MESTSDGSRLRTHPPLHGSSEIQPQCFSMFQPHSMVFAFLDPTCLSAMAGTAADWEENLMFECLNIFFFAMKLQFHGENNDWLHFGVHYFQANLIVIQLKTIFLFGNTLHGVRHFGGGWRGPMTFEACLTYDKTWILQQVISFALNGFNLYPSISV